VWFVLLAIALAILVAGGLYFRRRLLASLRLFGLSRRSARLVGLAIVWLLYGLPALVFISIVASIALGRDSFPLPPAGVGDWLLVHPFWFAVLVMLQAVPFLVAFDLASVAARRWLERERLDRYRAAGCLAVIAVFSVYTPARIGIERGALEVNHHEVGSSDSADRFRIGFLADLQRDHHTDQDRTDQVVSRINEQAPDLVLVGGDWINTGSEFIEAAAASGGELRSRLGTLSVRGDHEHFAYRDRERSVREVSDALDRHGVEMVDNQVRFIDHRGKRIAVIFLSYNYIFRTPAAEIRELLASARGADYSILVTHQLDPALSAIVEDQVDLVLVAHTHGGQVNPVVGFVHVSIARVETPYISGRYQLGSTTIIVTSGIGFSIAPFRYAAPASIEIIDLGL
jgi:hypothetical protein